MKINMIRPLERMIYKDIDRSYDGFYDMENGTRVVVTKGKIFCEGAIPEQADEVLKYYKFVPDLNQIL